MGLIHLDAHRDTGGVHDGTRFHHGGPFRNAVLDGHLDPERCVQIGIRGASEYPREFSTDSGMTVIHADGGPRLGVAGVMEVARRVVGNGPVHVSFDVDRLDPAFTPGTGTPEAGGLSSREVLDISRGLDGLNVVGGDVVEEAPDLEATTITARAAARVLFEIFRLIAGGVSRRREPTLWEKVNP